MPRSIDESVETTFYDCPRGIVEVSPGNLVTASWKPLSSYQAASDEDAEATALALVAEGSEPASEESLIQEAACLEGLLSSTLLPSSKREEYAARVEEIVETLQSRNTL